MLHYADWRLGAAAAAAAALFRYWLRISAWPAHNGERGALLKGPHANHRRSPVVGSGGVGVGSGGGVRVGVIRVRWAMRRGEELIQKDEIGWVCVCNNMAT